MYWQAKSQQRSRASRHGFTLIEVMVVIVILGLLTTVVTVNVRRHLIQSKQNVARMEISKVCQALETFYTEADRYPTNQEGIEALAQPTGSTGEGILNFIPADPWGNPYEYVSPGKSSPYEVTSYGADRREGGTGADTDISSNDIGNDRTE